MKNSFRKFVSALLALIMVVSIIPMSVFTASAVTSGTCGDNLTWILYADGELVISGAGEMEDYNYYSIYAPWKNYRSSIKKVTIKDGVTSIGSSAFYYCESLTSITIPDSVTSIGSWTFYDCSSLTSITIGAGVTSIGSYAFSDCKSLTSITIPDSVTSIDNDVFSSCNSLTSIEVNNGNQYYSSDSFGVLYNKDKTKLIQYPRGNERTTFVIPDSVTSIGVDAFEYCNSLTSVTIPDSVTSIGSWTFSNCDSLTSITIPDSVTSIGEYAFWSCNSLTSVAIGNGVTSIGNSAFSGCSRLTSITIPDSVTSIGNSAFSYCNSLTSITIGAGVTSIGDDVFSSCNSLTSIEVNDGNQYYSSDSFGVLYNKDKTELIKYPLGNERTVFVIPDSVTSIGDYAFCGCIGITSVTIPDSVTSIGEYAFGYCSSLISVTIGNGVTIIEYGAFWGCSNLTNITIPDSVISIETGAFAFCDWVESVTIGAGVTSISPDSFFYSWLTSIEVSDDNQYYSNDSFGVLYNKDKTELIHYPIGNERTTFAIPDSVTSIGVAAFYFKYKLKIITIPDSVTSIGMLAFMDDGYSDTDFYYYGTEEEWNNISIGMDNYGLMNATIHFNHSNHLYDSLVTPPTCTEQGYTTYTCECSDSYISDYVDATGHTSDEWIYDTLPSIYEAGKKHKECNVCGDIFEEDAVAEKIIPDINGDGKINSMDALIILNISVGKDAGLSKEEMLKTDANGDGKINSMDALIVLNISVGNIKIDE